MTHIRTVLSINMKEKRKKLKLSQAQLAEKIDTSPNYISKIEAEKQFPSVQMIEAIAEALQCDTIDLFSTKSITKKSLSTLKNNLCSDITNLIENYFSSL